MQDEENTSTQKPDSREAAANVIRDDIERIYGNNSTPHTEVENNIRQTRIRETLKKSVAPEHTDQLENHKKIEEQWKHYHTSWSSYYQQYYERYYLNHLHNAKKEISQNAQTGVIASESDQPPEEDKAVAELQQQLLGTVKERAVQVKKSRHYVPIMTGVVFALIFLFLQYNQFLFATVNAYISPGSVDSQNIVLDPTNIKVGPEPKLIIPKINVEAPVVYGVDPLDNKAVEDALREGVVHYPIANAASAPGQVGAATILGHSSMDVFDNGEYKFVFVQLNKLNKGDTFYINHKGTRYTYSVTGKEIISPKEISKVRPADPTKPSVILITCDPPGTALKRLLVFAEQISPDPAGAKAADTNKPAVSTETIRGDAPSFLERLFGG